MFKKFQALKQVYKTITSTKPKTTEAGKKKIELLKKLGSNQKKIGIDKYKKMGGNKLANEVLNVDKKAKGGRIGLKGGGFPDHSGDGKITKKDILMAKGVIPKPKNKNKKKVIG